MNEKTIGEELFDISRKRNPRIVEWESQPQETHEIYEALAQEPFDLWKSRLVEREK